MWAGNRDSNNLSWSLMEQDKQRERYRGRKNQELPSEVDKEGGTEGRERWRESDNKDHSKRFK